MRARRRSDKGGEGGGKKELTLTEFGMHQQRCQDGGGGKGGKERTREP